MATFLALALVSNGAGGLLRADDRHDHEHGWRLAPFAGSVAGELQLQLLPDGTLALLAAPPAAISGSHIGQGVQLYDEASMVIAPVVDPNLGVIGMSVSGAAVTVAANGDMMNIAFTLDGLFVSPTQLQYTGSYVVLPGGTGRFEYEHAGPEANLGSGLIQGQATLVVDPATGQAVLSFAHDFSGDLAVGKAEAKKPKKSKSKHRKGEEEDEDED